MRCNFRRNKTVHGVSTANEGFESVVRTEAAVCVGMLPTTKAGRTVRGYRKGHPILGSIFVSVVQGHDIGEDWYSRLSRCSVGLLSTKSAEPRIWGFRAGSRA